MTLKMSNREVDGVTVVALDGRIVLGEETNSLREKVKGLLGEGKQKLVLDMSNVSLIDSAGLGTLVGVHQSARTRGASLSLCNVGSKIKELLVMTRLIVIFGEGVSNNEAEVVRALSKGA